MFKVNSKDTRMTLMACNSTVQFAAMTLLFDFFQLFWIFFFFFCKLILFKPFKSIFGFGSYGSFYIKCVTKNPAIRKKQTKLGQM